MASKTCDVIRYDDTEYDLNDKEDVVELFNDLVRTIDYLRYDIRSLRKDFDYLSSHVVHRYNSEED